jgi:hypothetical protein
MAQSGSLYSPSLRAPIKALSVLSSCSTLGKNVNAGRKTTSNA